ncbi:MAG: nucleotidyltransferase family protein [Chloroflexi bacterium]|nr:nucleotidyltransferase family protein [Chloroflexota bacterium]MBI1855451.1 nucleotidyltransferase family protein [Chloroflexota bacterium]MBI3339535.1 nucleotidyltransferase family protein [Chloroflexota bacterium]
MDQTNDSGGINQTYRLLALCARADGHPVFYEQLARLINQFTAWQELPPQAELHGVSPLLWYHIHKSGAVIPNETERVLKGLYLRQRAYNRIAAQVLIEITTLFENSNIRPLLLKGLALAYKYYPDPGLRPTSDIDLLLNQADVLPALDLLASAGFRVDPPHASRTRGLIPKELTADSPLRGGHRIRVELHHYDPKGRHEKGNSPDPEFNGFHAPPQILIINKNIVYTSTFMETLHYLSRHLEKHLFIGNSNKPAQLKWTADIISLVEYHAEEIDWTHLQQQHPDILNRLDVLYNLTPLPEHLKKIIPLRPVTNLSGLNQYPPGWPHQSIQQWKQVGFLRFIWQVFIPPADWWLRLNYGINERSLFWYRHIVYRMQICKAIFQALIHKVGEFTST